MSFLIAVRSAVFYYVSCTPCNKWHQEHRRKADARQARKERELCIVTEQPTAYRHPEACSTNPWWDEEIRAGPRPPPKKSGYNHSRSNHRLGSSGRGSARSGARSRSRSSGAPTASLSGTTVTATRSQQLPTANETDAGEEEGGPAWTVPGVSGGDGAEVDDQQGSVRRVVDALFKAGSSAGRFVEETLRIEKPAVTEEDRYDFYFGHRNPSVNDFHPPVVSAKPPHPDLHRWMTEPPPPARIMEGRVPMRRLSSSAFGRRPAAAANASASASASTISTNSRTPLPTPTTDDPPPFDRTLLEKRLEESARLARGPSEEELINSLIGRPQTKSVLALTQRRSFSIESSAAAATCGDNHLLHPYAKAEKRGRPRRASHSIDVLYPFVLVSTLPHVDRIDRVDRGHDHARIPSITRVDVDAVAPTTPTTTPTPPTAPLHAACRPKLEPIPSSRLNIPTAATLAATKTHPAPPSSDLGSARPTATETAGNGISVC